MTDFTTADRREISQTIFIAARPATVWEFWVDPRRMAEWWGESAQLEPRRGGLYRVVMDAGTVMRGEYVELVPHERIVFTFGWEANGDPALPAGSTVVEITLLPEGSGTRLTLRHAQVPAGSEGRHADGWQHFLGMLATVAAGR